MRDFSKTHQSSLTLKGGSTSHLGLLPSGKKRKPPYSVLKPLRYKVGGPSEVFASSGAAVCGMRPHGHESLTGCLLDACCSCWVLAECSLDTGGFQGAGDCCQGLFGEFLGQHVLEEEGVAEDVTTPHAAGLFQETVEPFETVVLPP